MLRSSYARDKRVVTLAGAGHNDSLTPEQTAEFYRAFDWLLAKAGISRSSQ